MSFSLYLELKYALLVARDAFRKALLVELLNRLRVHERGRVVRVQRVRLVGVGYLRGVSRKAVGDSVGGAGELAVVLTDRDQRIYLSVGGRLEVAIRRAVVLGDGAVRVCLVGVATRSPAAVLATASMEVPARPARVAPGLLEPRGNPPGMVLACLGDRRGAVLPQIGLDLVGVHSPFEPVELVLDLHEGLLNPLLALFTSRRGPPGRLLPPPLRLLLEACLCVIFLEYEPSRVLVAVLIGGDVPTSLDLRLPDVVVPFVVGGVVQLDLHVIGVILVSRVPVRPAVPPLRGVWQVRLLALLLLDPVWGPKLRVEVHRPLTCSLPGLPTPDFPAAVQRADLLDLIDHGLRLSADVLACRPLEPERRRPTGARSRCEPGEVLYATLVLLRPQELDLGLHVLDLLAQEKDYVVPLLELLLIELLLLLLRGVVQVLQARCILKVKLGLAREVRLREELHLGLDVRRQLLV